MTIDTRYTAAIRNTLLQQMHDASSRIAPDGSRESATAEPARPGTTADSVSLSDDARRIHAAIHADTVAVVTDRARINELRSAIADGSFTIDSARVAEKLYRLDSEL